MHASDWEAVMRDLAANDWQPSESETGEWVFCKETLDTYADLFDADLDSVAVALNHVGTNMNVGKTWANTDQPGLRLVDK